MNNLVKAALVGMGIGIYVGVCATISAAQKPYSRVVDLYSDAVDRYNELVHLYVNESNRHNELVKAYKDLRNKVIAEKLARDIVNADKTDLEEI